jgi:hypothetical protein
MSGYWFFVAGLAVWRIAHLAHAEDGPWKVVARIRARVAGGFLGSVMGCLYCLSLWIAALFAGLIAQSWREGVLVWPALSAMAILFESVMVRITRPEPRLWIEDTEKLGKQ